MLNVKAMPATQANAGKPSLTFEKSTFFNEDIIKKPMMTNTGATAQNGTDKNNGEKNNATANNVAATNVLNPVLAPSIVMETLSTNPVTVVPKTAPVTVAAPAQKKARPIFGMPPSFCKRFPCVQTASNVPNVSKTFKNKNVKQMKNKSMTETPFNEKSQNSGNDGNDISVKRSGKTVVFKKTPATVAVKTPVKKAPRIDRACIANVTVKPISAVHPSGVSNRPKDTNVALSATTQPHPFAPMNAINRPIPAETADFKDGGNASTILSRTLKNDIRQNKTPAINNAANPV